MIITGIFLLLVLALVAAYDLYVYVVKGSDYTISTLMWYVNQKWPLFSALVAFAAGVLYGHFFFAMQP